MRRVLQQRGGPGPAAGRTHGSLRVPWGAGLGRAVLERALRKGCGRARWVLGLAAVLLLVGCGKDPAPPAPQTILLLTVDTLRADAVGALSGARAERSPTPHIDALASQCLRFETARTCVPLTLPAHVTMLSGLPPAVTGVRVNTYGRLPAPADRGFPLLQEQLRAAGWRTAAFVSAKVLGRRFGLDQGFDVYDDEFEGDLTDLTIAERAGPTTVGRALAWLGNQPSSQRCFLWVHLFEPHAPYRRNGTYAGDVSAADEAVGQLLQGLERQGRGEAITLLTSDHGEMLGDLGEATHALLLADGALRVPFLLRVPGSAPGLRTDAALVADVAPTLGRLAGLPFSTPPAVGCGRDLLAAPGASGPRAQVAESLHAHHRYRWAQLLSASGPTGTLVDAGEGRLHFLVPAPLRSGHGNWQPADPLDPAVQALGLDLAAYRALERPERMQQGAGSGGYGAGEVAPLLEPQENGTLPDPYRQIPLVADLDRIHALLRSSTSTPRMLVAQIDRLKGLQGGRENQANPEIAFLLGEAWLRLAELDNAQGGAPGPSLAAAEAAYLEAFRLGRRDCATLVRACGANALDREPQALALLESLAPQVAHLDCDVWVLKARLHKAMGQDQEAEAACEKARQECGEPRQRDRMQTTCR